MLPNILRVAWRGLWRHRAFTALNVAGLAVGMACALLIGLYVQDELRFDRYHAHADRTYRVVTGTESTAYEGIAKVPAPWGLAVQEALPEVEAMVRLRFFGETLVQRGAARFYEGGAFTADPSVFDVFSFAVQRGDPATALAEPNTLVLTETVARKYFGDEDPLGQTLLFDNAREMTVTGVMADVPPNSHFTFPFLVSRASETDSLQYAWNRTQYYTYLRLAEGASAEGVAAKIPAVLRDHLDVETAATYRPWLQPLPSIHLHSNLFREMAVNGDVAYVYLFTAIAFFILLIACVNFMNLATARASRRAHEVGVRKAAGAGRGALIRQFLGEAWLLSGLALGLALGLVSLALPTFEALTGKELGGLLWGAPWSLPALGVLAVGVGLLAGSYPAFVLSAFRPAEVLKGTVPGLRHGRLRRGLVVFQFAVSAFLIVAAGVVGDQLAFIQQKNLGYDQEHLVVLPIRSDALRQGYQPFKEAVRAVPGVAGVTASANLPGGGDYGIPIVVEGRDPADTPSMRILAVDADFIETLRMDLTAGRAFSADRAADGSGGAFLLNEEAVRQLGWDAGEALGRTLSMPVVGIDPAPVIGVVDDFHFRSMREAIGPLAFFVPPPPWYAIFTVRLRPDGVEATLAALEATWTQFEPDHPFTYSFLDDQIAALHAADERVRVLLRYATGLAVFIACLGLFGLAAFTAEQRTKEIGVRKVLGASLPTLVGLMTREFLVLVLAGVLIAAPVAYLALDRWLDDFAYRTPLEPGTFAVAALLALAVAALTVSYQSVKAALADPVDSLRYE